MGRMFSLLKEDNEQVMEMIRQLDQKILDLRKAGRIPSDYSQAITEFYQEATLPWMEKYYIPNKEINPEAEQKVADKIYDLFSLRKALED